MSWSWTWLLIISWHRRQDTISASLTHRNPSNGMSFDNDAKACYDRIVMPLALLASQHLGMPTEVCQWYQQLLSKAKYHIQLPDDISTEFYTSTTAQPLHGPGQGSRAAPSLWVLVSSIIMNCMSLKSGGVTSSDPQKQKTTHYIMTGFVDDTTHWINQFDKAITGEYTKDEMYQDTQRTAQCWEQLLYATGGKLELNKCFYYPIIWQFDEEGIPALTTTSDDNIKILSSETGEHVPIQAKSPYQSHKTLGILENPSGIYDDEYENIRKISEKWQYSISNQYLSSPECTIFYQSFYLPSIRYHLTVGTFDEHQLH